MLEHKSSDTIAAVATPAGIGAIGIVRVSGPMASTVLSHFFKPSKDIPQFESHTLYYGWLVNSDCPLDDVLVVFMEEGKSYTGEPLAEFHCHGNPVILQSALDLFTSLPGVRVAEPGEFTKRAFLNGKIDLTQAEAVMDLIGAQSKEALLIASRQQRGLLSHEIQQIKNTVVPIKAHCEALIDFAVQEIADLPTEEVQLNLEDVLRRVKKLLATAQSWHVQFAGVQVAIIGKPNVGKSSLLNALLSRNRVIVSPLAGTTRDTIEERILWQGIPFRLVDTAGIRETNNLVENEGVMRSLEQVDTADVLLWVMDSSSPLDKEECVYLNKLKDHPALFLVINKIDLAPQLESSSLPSGIGKKMVKTSCKEEWGIEELKTAIVNHVIHKTSLSEGDSNILVNERHGRACQKIVFAIESALAHLRSENLALDLFVVDLQEAIAQLEEILGESINTEVLDAIFQQFCLGK